MKESWGTLYMRKDKWVITFRPVGSWRHKIAGDYSFEFSGDFSFNLRIRSENN